MRRLSEFEHHEVRDVNDVVDRTDASALNFRAQPLRTRSDFHVVDPTRREKWTLTCRANRHAGFFDGNFGFAGRRLQFLAGERCDFAREAKMTEQIAAVRSDLDVENRIAWEKIGNRRANFCFRRQNQQARGVFAQAELNGAA